MKLFARTIDSPVGKLTLIASEKSLVTILFPTGKSSKSDLIALAENGDNEVLRKTEKQLNEYFAGHRTTFDLPLEAAGTTFQKSVWTALCKIPFGTTKSYGELAAEIGSPKGSRAVGAANGRNPIPIVVPCHRVIGSDGSMTGFGGGTQTKSFLLKLEGRSN